MPLLLRICFATLFALFLNACGGSDGDDPTPPPPPPPAIVTVALGASASSIQVNQTAQFNATVTGTTNTQVTYSVEGGNANGTISAGGLYTAPAQPGVFTVRATSVADTTRSATAVITVTAAVVQAITITPATATVAAGGSVAFSANEAATFAVAGGNANGTVVATGPGNASYTAPTTPGAYQVVATATADATRKATATVTVSAGGGFSVSSNVRIAPGTTTQFSAFLNGQPAAATWSIVGACAGCSINSSGLFTAGSTVQSATVQATNPANLSQVATAIVTIATEVTLTMNAPPAPSLTWADMLTFGGVISPSGIENGLTFTTGPGGSAGSVINVDYFFGWLPPPATGAYTVTTASVADPTKSATIAVQVTAPPATALVATAGAPASMRIDHAAAAMADGRIVIAGGVQDRQGFVPVLPSEVFNPATGTFANGPALAVDRPRPEAIAIDANRVLVTGGREDWNISRNTAEVLNLSTGAAGPTGNTMSARRIHHGMARLTTGPNAGKILVVGGFNGPIPYGIPTWIATGTADLFDPATNTFSPAPAGMRTARGTFTTTALSDGRILVVGGFEPEGAGRLASAEIYDPVAGTFTFTGSMTVARSGHTATRLADGKVLIVGGDRDAATQSSAEIYDPATGAFSAAASLLAATRSDHAAAALADGRVLIFGGQGGDFYVRGTVEVFDPATRAFSLYGRMSIPRTRFTATPVTAGAANGKVLVFGGGARNTPATAAELTP
ncbi:MAG: kelch repeat-containing protein [Ramlibacter sp.]